MKKIIIIIASFFIVCCTKQIEIDIPHEKPKLVVYSTIVPFTLPSPKILELMLQSSAHIFDSIANNIGDATVLYYENDILKDTLQYVDSSQTYHISHSISNYPIVGNTYSIVIIKEGFDTLCCSTKIPSKVLITDTTILPVAYRNETGDVYSEISITFTDPADEENFYEIAVSDVAFKYDNPLDYYELFTYENIITSESYYPSVLNFEIRQPKYLLFSDKTFNGTEKTIRFFYIPPQLEGEERFIIPHYISMHLRNVTEEYYTFKTSMIHHINSNTETVLYGMGEPLNVLSNITNGYGLFAGFNNDIVTIQLPQQKIPK